MAYQHASVAHDTDLPHRLWNGIKSFFAAVGTSLVAASSANRRLQLVERLSAKSDEELAAMGIRREDIVRRVFSDVLSL